MKVILQEDVANLGVMGDVVTVADGYGRNFLIPRSLASLVDDSKVLAIQHQKKVAANKRAKALAEAQALAEKLNNTAISLKRPAGDEDKLFGAVTNRDIADALTAEGFAVDRRAVHLEDPIKTIGVFHVDVKLPLGVAAQVKVYVLRA